MTGNEWLTIASMAGVVGLGFLGEYLQWTWRAPLVLDRLWVRGDRQEGQSCSLHLVVRNRSWRSQPDVTVYLGDSKTGESQTIHAGASVTYHLVDLDFLYTSLHPYFLRIHIVRVAGPNSGPWSRRMTLIYQSAFNASDDTAEREASLLGLPFVTIERSV